MTENTSAAEQVQAAAAAAAAAVTVPAPAAYTPTPVTVPTAVQAPRASTLQQQQSMQALMQDLANFWSNQLAEVNRITDFKNHLLPLARIKKIMKSDEDVRMISAEAPVLFAKACEMFILELTLRAWNQTEEAKRRTLQRSDISAAIQRTDIFDFLIDIVPRDDPKKDEPRPAAAVDPTQMQYYSMAAAGMPPGYGIAAQISGAATSGAEASTGIMYQQNPQAAVYANSYGMAYPPGAINAQYLRNMGQQPIYGVPGVPYNQPYVQGSQEQQPPQQ